MRRTLGSLLAACLLAGCAAEVARLPSAPLSVPAASSHPELIELTRPALVQTGTGYDRALAAGTRWRFAGVAAQGAVYRAAQGVFTLEGANIHEAYLVLRGEELVGFYLPVEQAYSPLKETIRLSFRNQ